MAQKQGRQGEWPTVKGNPVADYLTPDGYLRSSRSLAGPLRMGTEPRVGPKGLVEGGGGASDFGMDRITPRGFDPMGTSDTRAPPQEGSTLLSRSVRNRD